MDTPGSDAADAPSRARSPLLAVGAVLCLGVLAAVSSPGWDTERNVVPGRAPITTTVETGDRPASPGTTDPATSPTTSTTTSEPTIDPNEQATTAPARGPTSTTATTTSAPAGPPCGGPLREEGMARPCTFADEFDGDALDREKWHVHETDVDGYISGRGCMVDDPANIEVDDGVLTLTARAVDHEFDCGRDPTITTSYTAATVSTLHHFAQRYGRVEIRARVVGATAPGLHSALWMWPEQAWNLKDIAEIDIAEMYSLHPDRAIPYLHHMGSVVDLSDTNNYCLLDTSEWHTYTLDWTEAGITISFDDQVCLRNRWNLVTGLLHGYDQPFFVILTQALGIGKNAFDPETTPLPASTQIDYVRVWE